MLPIRNYNPRGTLLRLAGLFLLCLALTLPQPAVGWPCAVRIRAFRDALLWTPRLLRVLVDHWGPDVRPILCGRLPSPDPGDTGGTPVGIADLQQWDREIPRRMYRHRDLGAYLDMMPRSARLIVEAFDPVRHMDDPDPARQFYAYTLRMLPRIPKVFYGYPDPDLERGNFVSWLGQADQRSRTWARRLRDPARFGFPLTPSQWSALDHRTPAYAMAALSLQHSVTYIVRYWLRLWRKGHGSMRDLPVPWQPGIYVMYTQEPNYPRGR